jgi:starch synthase
MLGSLKVVIVASEVVPFAKTGGLADVTGALSKALAALGHQVSVMMPRYPMVERAVRSLEKIHDGVAVPMGASTERGVIWSARVAPRIPIYFIEHQGMFGREALYTTADGDYSDNAQRFAFLAKAALAACRELNLQPDVIHCHDWQTALLPAYLKVAQPHDDPLAAVGSVLTVHNLAYQGLFSPEVMAFLDLPPETYAPEGIEFYGRVNYLKAGIVYADVINTVSRRYKEEMQTEAFGFGLDGILRYRQQDVYGIVNGIDDREWNPSSDRRIAARYGLTNLAGKQLCKRDLLATFGLPTAVEQVPVVGMISHLVDHKGFDLLECIFQRMLALDLSLVVLGRGDPHHEAFLQQIQARYPTKVGLSLGVDDTLAHKIIAGSDIFLMPSQFEPCGLNQMYSLHYGTIPVVHATGGLDDTIESYDAVVESGNGFKFTPYEAEALLATLQQALALYRQRDAWERLMRRGMQADFSWAKPAQEYVTLYTRAAAKRRGTTVLV